MESFKLIYFTVHQDLKYHFLPKQIMRRISVTTKNKKTSVPETQYFSIIQDFCSLPLSRLVLTTSSSPENKPNTFENQKMSNDIS